MIRQQEKTKMAVCCVLAAKEHKCPSEGGVLSKVKADFIFELYSPGNLGLRVNINMSVGSATRWFI